MAWDVQRRDGRTFSECEEIITVRGIIISETKSELVIRTETEDITVIKASFRYCEMDRNNKRFYVLAKNNNTYKLIDYI